MPLEESESLFHSIGGKRIGINAHLLSGEAGFRRAGIHQYIAQVLGHLPRMEGGPQYILYTRHASAVAGNRPDLLFASTKWPTERRWVRIAWEQTVWPILAWRQSLDLIHGMAFVAPRLSPCPTVVTVYDVSFLRFPDRYPVLQRIYLASQTARSCRQARRVITISESARQDIHDLLGVPLDRIDVVRPGVDSMFRPLPGVEVEAFRQREALPGQFILHVGTLQPRKNLPVLLDAFARIARDDLQLVLVGGRGWYYREIYQRIEALGITAQVRFTGYVPDQDLPFWYNSAALLVLPSAYEGFGMPVIEAMACGTPVVAADTSSIPEAAGDGALLFDPKDTIGLADRMLSVLNDANLSARMKERGLLHARGFTWERAGKETIDAYARALAS